MSVHKDCADNLRARFRALTGLKLGSGHAHEIVAAYFGYGTGSALRLEGIYPLDELWRAEILIPDLALMERRLFLLTDLPDELPGADVLADWIGESLQEARHFTGAIWHTRDIADYIGSVFVHEHPHQIMDAMSSEMAVTNALFLGFDIEESTISKYDEGMSATVNGRIEGESDQDKPFYGDAIDFETILTFDLVAGRNAYGSPSWETTGELDLSFYDDDRAEQAN